MYESAGDQGLRSGRQFCVSWARWAAGLPSLPVGGSGRADATQVLHPLCLFVLCARQLPYMVRQSTAGALSLPLNAVTLYGT